MSNSTPKSDPGLSAKGFEDIFQKAGVLADGLDGAKSAAAKATRIGKFLAPNVGREVPISVNGRSGKAKLCMSQVRSNQKLYHFEVRWDGPEAEADGEAAAQVRLNDGLDHEQPADPEAGRATVGSTAPDTPQAGDTQVDSSNGGREGNEEQW